MRSGHGLALFRLVSEALAQRVCLRQVWCMARRAGSSMGGSMPATAAVYCPIADRPARVIFSRG